MGTCEDVGKTLDSFPAPCVSGHPSLQVWNSDAPSSGRKLDSSALWSVRRHQDKTKQNKTKHKLHEKSKQKIVI